MNAISYYFARKFLNKANRAHMARYPQLACYSFDLITTFIHLEGQYERDQLELLARDVFPKLPHPSTCLDVGANIGNIGPGLGKVGPAENYNFFADPLKWLCVFNMLAGRLEIYSVIIILIPEYWRR